MCNNEHYSWDSISCFFIFSGKQVNETELGFETEFLVVLFIKNPLKSP